MGEGLKDRDREATEKGLGTGRTQGTVRRLKSGRFPCWTRQEDFMQRKANPWVCEGGCQCPAAAPACSSQPVVPQAGVGGTLGAQMRCLQVGGDEEETLPL
jgi:hypothetical protein